MRMKHAFIPTLRETPGDAKAVSYQLMLKAGLIRQVAAGVYSFLPAGLKVLHHIQSIIREEMNAIGAQELLLPALHPAELWQASGRWEQYGPELMRLTDRHGSSFALGATHEEAVTSLIANEIKSYRKLPLTVYQIQTKYRDERRPRFGVLRSREFVMKDAYSFDSTQEGLDATYEAMYASYSAIFKRCGLTFRAVEADSGAIGGSNTHEFMALCEVGEDTIAYCTSCDYAANLEKAEVATPKDTTESPAAIGQLQKTHTPNVKTIDQLAAFFDVSPARVIKSVACRVDGEIVVALVRGDYAVNEIKLKNALQASEAELLDEESIVKAFGCKPGFIGPLGLEGVKIVADYSVLTIRGGIIGANEADFHYTGVEAGRDFQANYRDIRNITENDHCPRCGDPIRFTEGIEVGQVFKLGTKYSRSIGAYCSNEQGENIPMIMGCYGIGVSRTIAAIIEQHHDEEGIVWPTGIAPYSIQLVAVSMQDETQRSVAERLYAELTAAGYEVLFDDRDERPGVKFKDADLLGLPVRITVGKRAAEGVVEYGLRSARTKTDVPLEQLPELLTEALH